MITVDRFYDEFLDRLGDADELRTIFYTARQTTESIVKNPAFRELPADDARIMAQSLAVALELIRRYESRES